MNDPLVVRVGSDELWDTEEVVLGVVDETSYEVHLFRDQVRMPPDGLLIDTVETTLRAAIERAQRLLKQYEGVAYISTLADFDENEDPLGPDAEGEIDLLQREMLLRTYIVKDRRVLFFDRR